MFKLAALILFSCFGIVARAFQRDAQVWFIGSTVVDRKPNIVFILTDDQDMQMNSIAYMPYLQKHLLDKGTLFRRHYCGYPKFVSQGFNEAWLPVWLQTAGYATYYTGKLFNSHTLRNYDSPFPVGFNRSDFLLDPHTYEYLNASYDGNYSTGVLASKAYGFLDSAVAGKHPFFLTIAPDAPHSNVKFLDSWFDNNVSEYTIETSPPIPAERHKNMFPNVIFPRTPNFNPEEPSGVSWISSLKRQNQTNIDFNDEFYRDRLRAPQAVDEIVAGVFSRLAVSGLLDNTYVFYSSNNGYHIGQHRLQPGKECGFEEEINITLIFRGPGVPEDQISDLVTSHNDLTPTFLSLAQVDLRADLDGAVIPLTQSDLNEAVHTRHEHANAEYWGFALAEGKYGNNVYWNNTYRALRLIGDDYNLYYSVWCSGEHELYDMNNDPYQIKNLFTRNNSSTFRFQSTSTNATARKTTLSHLISRLDPLILVLNTCKARECTHPKEEAKDLHDALAESFDDFYEVQQERVRFSKCEKGYILESEGPTGAKPFSVEDIGVRGGGKWSDLV